MLLSLSCVWLFANPRIPRCQTSLSFTIFLFSQTHVLWVDDAIQQLILCRPLLLLPSIFPSIRVFSNESAPCIRWPKYWSFSISPSNECSGLISFRIDCLISLQSKGLSRVLQHRRLKASILQCSAFFMVQLSHPYMITGKTLALCLLELFLCSSP